MAKVDSANADLAPTADPRASLAGCPPAAHAQPRSWWRVLLALGLLALALRLAIVLGIAPLNSYLPDHLDMMGWSAYAFEHGVNHLYDFRAKSGILTRLRLGTGEVIVTPHPVRHAYNYPPASAYVFWGQGALWVALDPTLVTRRVPEKWRDRIGGPNVTSRVVNTPTARFVQALPSILLDFVLALGVAATIAALRGTKIWANPEIAGFAVTLLCPPLLLDSALWNQMDAWTAAPLIWTVWALLRERWWTAGALYGIALLTKPQAILLAPLLLLAAAALRWGEGGSWRRAAQLSKSFAAALLAIMVIAGPFMLTDADEPGGPLRWLQRSYPETIGTNARAGTTFNAFNVWWLHWMAAGATVTERDSTKPMFGTTRQTVGTILLTIAVVAVLALSAWRARFHRHAWVTCAYLTCLAAFALPTGMHERYIYYCLPFLIALCATDWKRWLIPLVLLLVVGTFEMTSFAWVTWTDTAVEGGDRSRGNLLALMTLAAFAFSLAAAWRWPAPEPAERCTR